MVVFMINSQGELKVPDPLIHIPHYLINNDAFMNEVLDIMDEMGTEKIFGEMIN